MADLYNPPSVNAVQKTLAAELLTGATTSVTLNNVTNIVDGLGTFVVDRVDSNGASTASKREYITFTGVSGSTLTGLTRNADGGGSDQDHAVGAIVEFVPDAVQAKAVKDVIETEHGTDGVHGDVTLDTSADFIAEHNTDGTHSDVTADSLVTTTLGATTTTGVITAAKAIDITIADEGDDVGLTVTQNDVTNNPVAATITNAGTDHGLTVTQSGVLAANSAGLFVYSNTAQVTTGRGLAQIYQDNASSDTTVLGVKNDGTGNCLYLDNNSNGIALNIINSGTGTGIFIDNNANSKGIYIDSEATTEAALTLDTAVNNDQLIMWVKDASSVNTAFGLYRNTDVYRDMVLRLAGSYLWVDSTGDLRIHTAQPTSDTGGTVVGTQS